MKKNKKSDQDINDPKQDRKKLEADEGTLELPDVNDIPGQEKNQAFAGSGSMDATISSDNEEGYDVLDENENIITDKNTNVSSMERQLLDEAFDPASTNDEPINQLALDNKDDEGEILNEKSQNKHLFGDDLDTDLEEQEDEE
ncbi:MAG: hypothetical protein JST75_17495 [Bacteroidetes bacterium]|nr:hypothetical protein [Bacteroidota bacterium]